MPASFSRWAFLAVALLTPSLAAGETFITKDGKIYVGTAIMKGENAITVHTKGGTVTLDKQDLLDLSPEEANARALLWEGRQAKAKADKAYLADDLGQASYCYGISLATLTAIGERTKEQFAAASPLIEQVKARAEELRATLDERGLTEYKGQLFKTAILEHHLSQGHILLRKGIWVARSQICHGCGGKGLTPCAACSATGRSSVRCPYCRNGQVPNPRGKGTGKATCSYCGGRGQIYVKCPTCRGRGSVVCSNCRGKGRVRERCTHCDGKGHITIRIKLRDNWGNVFWGKGKTTCTACGGKGRVEVECAVCAGDGWVNCYSCGGSGKRSARCSNCGGRGYIAVPTKVPCPTCHGTRFLAKVCEACAGRGYTTCPDCGGKGYIGEPCPDPPAEPETEDADSAPETSRAYEGAHRPG